VTLPEDAATGAVGDPAGAGPVEGPIDGGVDGPADGTEDDAGPIRVGDPAPDFTLDGVDGRTGEPVTVTLSALRGHPVVLAFYPADDSPVCTAQLTEYTRTISEFEELDATVLAVSPQAPESHRAFAEGQGGFAFPLLSDEDLAVGRAYGVVGLLDLYRRSTFVIDADGVVRYAHRYLNSAAGYRTTPDLVEILTGI
jgi:peroxiredoxin Q/BCP